MNYLKVHDRYVCFYQRTYLSMGMGMGMGMGMDIGMGLSMGMSMGMFVTEICSVCACVCGCCQGVRTLQALSDDRVASVFDCSRIVTHAGHTVGVSVEAAPELSCAQHWHGM